jgi:hypothetical protein
MIGVVQVWTSKQLDFCFMTYHFQMLSKLVKYFLLPKLTYRGKVDCLPTKVDCIQIHFQKQIFAQICQIQQHLLKTAQHQC